MIVATSEEELPRLSNLLDRATANGVPGVRIIEAAELRELEPHCRGVRALWSPNTGIVDYGQVARSYAGEIVDAGGEIRLNSEVTAIERRAGRSLVTTTGGTLETGTVITCAGLHSDRVAALTGADPTLPAPHVGHTTAAALARSAVRARRLSVDSGARPLTRPPRGVGRGYWNALRRRPVPRREGAHRAPGGGPSFARSDAS